MLLKKWHCQTCLTQGCHKPSIREKLEKAQCSKGQCACNKNQLLDLAPPRGPCSPYKGLVSAQEACSVGTPNKSSGVTQT